MIKARVLAGAAAFVALLGTVVVAPTPAQAVGTYNRVLENAESGLCLARGSIDAALKLAACGNADTKWYVEVKSDSYNGTGHEVWQIRNATFTDRCLVTYSYSAYLGSCQYSGSVPNKYEVFKYSVGGETIVQLKDIEAWENSGAHRCLTYSSTGNVVAYQCVEDWKSRWDPAAW